ncbi:hypothetical protein SLEP1_g34468 [Rubroshorea leprosula]|uniref:Seed biotin-containing protein SBP65 n=1 Tax=Rubroshorea leprosula TaxID=152421 RepID=A0AAV5KKA3_9ROSI|nr:hypothetical protein SLEP1_g34468 [Rubroshorea leprosula]
MVSRQQQISVHPPEAFTVASIRGCCRPIKLETGEQTGSITGPVLKTRMGHKLESDASLSHVESPTSDLKDESSASASQSYRHLTPVSAHLQTCQSPFTFPSFTLRPMASDQAQARRRGNTIVEREIHQVEKERVPMMASHFESLVDRARESDISTGGKVSPHECQRDSHDNKERRGNNVGDAAGAGKARESHELGARAVESPSVKLRDVNVSGLERGEEKDRQEGRTGGAFSVGNLRNQRPEQHTLGEISQLREAAQQNSMEAIRAAEERYNKAKDSAIQGLNAASEQTREKGALKDTSAQQVAHFSSGQDPQAKDDLHSDWNSLGQDHQASQEQGHQISERQCHQASQGQSHQASREQSHQVRQGQGHHASQGQNHQVSQGQGHQAKEFVHEAKQSALPEDTMRVQFSQGQGTQSKGTGRHARDTTIEGLSAVNQHAKERGTQANDNTQKTSQSQWERTGEAKDRSNQGHNVSNERANEKGTQAKGCILQNSHQYATEKSSQAKDVVLEGAQKTSQHLSEKTGNAKHALTNVGETGLKYTQQAKDCALQAKDTVVDVSKNAASYTGEKIVATKDVAVESRKEAADMKEKAPVVGWSAAHYTTEKAVEGTKIAAKVVQEAGQKAVEVAAKPLLNVAKDAVAAIGETLKEYIARKKEVAEREFEAKKSTEKQGFENREEQEDSNQDQENYESQPKQRKNKAIMPAKWGIQKEVEAEEPTQESRTTQQKRRNVEVGKEEQGNKGPQERGRSWEETKQHKGSQEQERKMRNVEVGKEEQVNKGPQERGRSWEETKQQKGSQEQERMQAEVGEVGGVLGAIGETIVEIAQTAKDMVIGPDQD